ncbi:hypothetical protein CHC07_06023 [Variovorax sp. B4]|nr:hypothetical protein CHC06_06117 [Variovorax sp. B2]PNG51366.1 hypothetical protein CHC07_06023 [Variovorax sp. B4]
MVLLGLGWLSLLGALCTAVSSFLNYGKTAEAHRLAADSYESIRRSVEVIAAGPKVQKSALQQELMELERRFQAADKIAPLRVRGVVGGGGDDDDDDDDGDGDDDDDIDEVDDNDFERVLARRNRGQREVRTPLR